MQSKSCPISFVRVDANIARISAFYVALLIILFLITTNKFIIFFLIIDFLTRILSKKDFSLVYMLSYITKDFLKLETLMIDAAPKKLAMLFGLAFVSAIFISSFFSFTFLVYLLSAVLLACVLLEVTFSYCLGCEIYHLYKRITI